MSASAITNTLAFTHGGTLRGLEGIITTGKLSSTAALEARGDATFKFTDAERQHVAEDKYLFFDCPQNNGCLTYQGVKHANEPGAGFQFVLVANGKSLVEQADLFGVSDGILMGRQDGAPLEIDVRKLDCKVLVPDCYKPHVDRMVELAQMAGKELDTAKLVFRPIEEVRQLLQEGRRPADPIAAQQALCRELGISAEPTARAINDAAGTVETKTSKVVVAHREELLDRASAPVVRVGPSTGAELVAHMRETPVYLNIQSDLRELFGGRGARSPTPRVLELKDRPEDLAHAVNMLVRMSPHSTYHKAFHAGEVAPAGQPFVGYFELAEIKAQVVRQGSDGQRVGELIDLANSGVVLNKETCQRVMRPSEHVAQMPPPPPLPQQAQMPPPLPAEPEVPSNQPSTAKRTIRDYEIPGAFELTAQGREPRFYDDARLAGEAFYAARREEQPRVVQHRVSGFEDRTGRYENLSVLPVAITALDKDGHWQHIFLDEAPEFRAGYEAARQRMPAKAVETDDWTQPAPVPVPQQQAVSALSFTAEPPRQPEVPTLATQVATEPKGQTVSDQQTPATPPRVQVGQDPNHWVNENAQWHRDVADRRGLTAGIEAQFAEGKTAKQVIKAMGKELEFLPIDDRSNFIVGVRATLGIPSQATSDGQQEFKAWKAEYDKRQALQSATPTQPQKEGPVMNLTRLQIDGVDVGRLAFEKHSTEHGVFVDLTALDRNNQPLAEFNGVDKNDLTKVLGPTVGHEVAKFNGRTGELAGQQLDVPAAEVAQAARGKSPQAVPHHAAQVPQKNAAQQEHSQATRTPEPASKAQGAAEVQAAPVRRMEIDGKEVQRLSYIKMQTPEGLRFDVTAYGSGSTVLGRHPGLSKEELPQYLGETPARNIEIARGRNGSLRGEQLQLRGNEARPQQTLPVNLQLPPRPRPERTVAERPIAPADTAQARQQQQPQPAQSHEAQRSTTSPETPPLAARTEPIVNSIERSNAQGQGGSSQTGKAGERSTEQPAAPATPAHQPGAPENPFLAAPEAPVDPAERRRQELLASLAERFTINAGEYRYRHDQAHVAFVDRDTAVTTHRNEPEIARAMVDLAEAKGWKGLHLKGTEAFRAAAWMEASLRGLKSHGYEPTRADRERLAIRLQDQQINRVEPAQEQTAGRQQQAAAAAAPTQAQQRDEVLVRREEALGVLEAYLKSQHKSPQEIAALLKQGGEMLDKMVAAGKPLPQARVYDINAQRAHTVHVQPQREVNSPARSR
ncbi:LPD7 domain-containing protein [Azohydromonas lata]|uniref:LPD7 domain-containing protein n=1 Tax=Azohydromonas lata TaxID=45677 RepID=UPI00083196EB|nr:LPD7 domain-containing protein [Azohydromonas lata]